LLKPLSKVFPHSSTKLNFQKLNIESSCGDGEEWGRGILQTGFTQ